MSSTLNEEKKKELNDLYVKLSVSPTFFRKYSDISKFYNAPQREIDAWKYYYLCAEKLYGLKDKLIEEYKSERKLRSVYTIDNIISGTTQLNRNRNKKYSQEISAYKEKMNIEFASLSTSIETVYKYFTKEKPKLSKCLSQEEIGGDLHYIVSDNQTVEKIKNKAQQKLDYYYQLAKSISKLNYSSHLITEEVFKDLYSSIYDDEIKRLNYIHNYVSSSFSNYKRYDFKSDVKINDLNPQDKVKAEKILDLVKRGVNTTEISTTLVEAKLAYLSERFAYIYKRIPNEIFNPNNYLNPDKMINMLESESILEKYYNLANTSGIRECNEVLGRLKKENPKFQGNKLWQDLTTLISLNEERKRINKVVINTNYSLYEYAMLSDEERAKVTEQLADSEKAIDNYLQENNNDTKLIQLYESLKDNEKFIKLFSSDIPVSEILMYLRIQREEYQNKKIDFLNLEDYVILTNEEKKALEKRIVRRRQVKFILRNQEFSVYDSIMLETLNDDEFLEIYKNCIVDYFNEKHPVYKNNNIDISKFSNYTVEELEEELFQGIREIIAETTIEQLNATYDLHLTREEYDKNKDKYELMYMKLLSEIRRKAEYDDFMNNSTSKK
jgi:hypothetical protein